MMRVPVRLGPSQIHGLGLHAIDPIPKGTVVWDYDWPIDQTIPVSARDKLPAHVQKYLAIYGYREGNNIVLCGDDARYFNHSKTPNCKSGHGTQTVALRDIRAGEELTDDYEGFDDDFPLYGHLLKQGPDGGTVPDARLAAGKEAKAKGDKVQAETVAKAKKSGAARKR